MAGDTVVVVRAGEVALAVVTSFARVPVPGEHVLLALSDAQRAQVGPEYGYGREKAWLLALVRETLLRQSDQWRVKVPDGMSPAGMIEEHKADIFAVAITTEAWRETFGRWGPG